MLPASSRSYVCWRCLGQGRNALRALGRPGARRLSPVQIVRSHLKDIHDIQLHILTTFVSQRLLTIQQQAKLSEHELGAAHIPKAAPEASSRLDTRPIRERLADWVPTEERVQQIIPDLSFYSKVTNSNTRSQSTGSSELDNFKSTKEGMTEAEDGAFAAGEDAETAVVGSSVRTPGDLVEIRCVLALPLSRKMQLMG